MTPQDAEQIMSPFYPHDPNLAMKAIGRELGENIPDWIIEAIVGSYFSFLQMKEVEATLFTLYMRSQQDPFNINTIPYTLDDTGVGLN